MTRENAYRAEQTSRFDRLAQALGEGTERGTLRALAQQALDVYASYADEGQGGLPWLPPAQYTRTLVHAALMLDDEDLFVALVEAHTAIEYRHYDAQRASGVSKEDRGALPTPARIVHQVLQRLDPQAWAIPQRAPWQPRLSGWVLHLKARESSG